MASCMDGCRRGAKLTISRLLASIYGRPPMISRASDVRLPSDVDRDYTIVDVGGTVSKERIPGASMFCLSVKLLNVFYEILETVYMNSQHQFSDRSKSQDAELLGKSLKLNHQLDQCLALMPDRLGCFIANPPNINLACNFSIHEQALVTRLVIYPSPKFISRDFHASTRANHDKISVRPDSALTPTDTDFWQPRISRVPRPRVNGSEGVLQLVLAVIGTACTQPSPGRRLASSPSRLACDLP